MEMSEGVEGQVMYNEIIFRLLDILLHFGLSVSCMRIIAALVNELVANNRASNPSIETCA